jgi:hypothetical protein
MATDLQILMDARLSAPDRIMSDIESKTPAAQCNSHASCPLTVGRGKIGLTEFGYCGVMLPNLPKAIANGTKPSEASGPFEEKVLPPICWKGRSKARERIAKSENTAAE